MKLSRPYQPCVQKYIFLSLLKSFKRSNSNHIDALKGSPRARKLSISFLLASGIELEDGPIYADEVSYVNDADRSQIGIDKRPYDKRGI